MKCFWALVLLLQFVPLANVDAAARQQPQVYILTEDVDRDAARCGIDRSSIETVAGTALRDNQVLVSPRPVTPYLYVAANLVHGNDGSCTFSIGVSLRRFVLNLGEFKKSGASPDDVVICEEKSTGQAPAGSAVALFSQSLKGDIKRCLSKLEY